MAGKKPADGEKTLIKGTGFSSFSLGSHMAAVDVKDGKVIRIRNFHYDCSPPSQVNCST